jgi:MFS transporter, putative metabolite transport protein
MGVAIGGEYSIGWPLMSEFAQAQLRGRLLGVTLIAGTPVS